jgi:HSP20 family molecular chaperone IbpA
VTAVERHLTTQEYLSSIAKRCRRLTAEEMLRSLKMESERSRMGRGHYLFDDRHPSYVDWSVPGALEFSFMECQGGFEVVFTTRPFERDEIHVHVDDGALEVAGEHEEVDHARGSSRSVRAERRIPLPPDVDLESVTARYTEGTLVVRVPRPKKGRRRIDIK